MTFALSIAVWAMTKLKTGTPKDVLSYIDFAWAELDKPSESSEFQRHDV